MLASVSATDYPCSQSAIKRRRLHAEPLYVAEQDTTDESLTGRNAYGIAGPENVYLTKKFQKFEKNFWGLPLTLKIFFR